MTVTLLRAIAAHLSSPIPQFSMSTSAFHHPSSLGVLRRSPPPFRRRPPATRTRPVRTAATAVLRPKIAVVGGGHAGLSTALRLASLPWTRLTRPQITLVDQADRFTFLPMLYELALSQVHQWEVAPRLLDLLDGTGVDFVHARVENLDLASLAVEGTRLDRPASPELRIPFDRAVLAVGAEASRLDAVPGASEHALPFYRLQDALALKERLASLTKEKTRGQVVNVVVVGGGFSGVELASCLAEHLATRGSILLIETSKQILRDATDFNRRTSIKALSANGASILYNTRVTNISPTHVIVDTDVDGSDAKQTTYPADLVLWTAGCRPNSVLKDFDVTLNPTDRVATDAYLQVKGQEGKIWAVGDGCQTPNDVYAGTAQVAVQQAEYAAWNIWAGLTGRRMLPYRYTHLGEMMVLGKTSAAVTASVGLELDGAAAWSARRIAYLARMPTESHRRRVAASWALNPLLDGIGNLAKASREYRQSV